MNKDESNQKNEGSRSKSSSESSKKKAGSTEKIIEDIKDTAKKGFENIKEAIDEIEIDTDEFKKDIKEGAKNIKGKAKKFAKELDENTKEFQEDAMSAGRDFKKGAKEAFEDLTEQNESKRILVGILAIILGPLGIHKFVLGYVKEGLVMLLVTVVSFGFGVWLTGLIGLIEGIIYLTKTDDEFYKTYQLNKRSWF